MSAKISSNHINGWLGDDGQLAMARRMRREPRRVEPQSHDPGPAAPALHLPRARR